MMNTREEFDRWVFTPNNPITAYKKAGELTIMWQGWQACQALNDARIAELEEKLRVVAFLEERNKVIASLDLNGMCEAFHRLIEKHVNEYDPFHNPIASDAQIALRELRGIVNLLI